MSVITSFVNVIAGASVLLGGKAFMDEKITADGPSIRKVVGVPLLGVGALGILVSYVRNKRVREDKKAESDFYEAELYEAVEDEYEEEVIESCEECGTVDSLYDYSEGKICKSCFNEENTKEAETFGAEYVHPNQPTKGRATSSPVIWDSKKGQLIDPPMFTVWIGNDTEHFETFEEALEFAKNDIEEDEEAQITISYYKTLNAETFDAEGGITFADVPRETLGGTNNNPVRIIVGGPPHSGKSTLMNLIEDKMNQYGVSVELRDLDFSAPTDLKGGFDQDREKKDWTPELAEEAATYFDEDSENRVILGDSIGLISRINEIVSEPADVAILLVSGSQGDDDRTYREAIKKWMQYYDDIDKPVLMVIRSSMNPEDMNYFDPHDNYGVIVGLDRNAYNQGGDSNEISLENACLEGIVFEIAQEFDLGLANRSTRRHIDIVEESWPSIRGKPTWNPIDAGKPHLARIEEEYFEELKRRKMGE